MFLILCFTSCMNPATDSMSDFSVTACGRMTTDADVEAEADDDEMEVAEPALEVDAVLARRPPPPPPPPPPPIGESVADIMAPNEPVAVTEFRYVLRDSSFECNGA